MHMSSVGPYRSVTGGDAGTGPIDGRTRRRLLGPPHAMLIARAMTSAARASETSVSAIIIILAHRLMADASAGPKVVAVAKYSAR